MDSQHNPEFRPRRQKLLSKPCCDRFSLPCFCFWDHWRHPCLPGACLIVQPSLETSAPTFQTHVLSTPCQEYSRQLLQPSLSPLQKAAFHHPLNPLSPRDLLWPLPLRKPSTLIPPHLSLFTPFMCPLWALSCPLTLPASLWTPSRDRA